VVDYKRLNDISKANVAPLPSIRQIMENFKGKKLFSKFDIRWGYNNIRVKEGDEWKAAIKTSQGLFEPKVMLFGTSGAPGTFQTFMNHMTQPIKDKYRDQDGTETLVVYMDDAGIATDDTPEGRQVHIECCKAFFAMCREYGLKIKLSKSTFMKSAMEFLGYFVTNGSITIDPSKVAGLKAWPRELHSVKDIRQVLGVLGFHRQFIPGFANIA
jgi:Reverse transcriptase (RNA-dependent DNA polymerase)